MIGHRLGRKVLCENMELCVNNLSTKKLTSTRGMFSGCNRLKTLDLGDFDFTSIADFSQMFRGCRSLKVIHANFNSAVAENLDSMFLDCQMLTEVDLSNMKTGKVTTMSNLFMGCESLGQLDLSNFDTSNTSEMDGMFADCYLLKTLDLSNFDTSKVVNLERMFKGCSNLVELNLSSFVLLNLVIYTDDMFRWCSRLEEVEMPNNKITYKIIERQLKEDEVHCELK